MDWQKIGAKLHGMGEGFAGRGSQWAYNQQREREMEEERRRREDEERRAEVAAVQAGGKDLAAFTFNQIRNRMEAGDIAGAQQIAPMHLRGLAQMGLPKEMLGGFVDIVRDPSQFQTQLPLYMKDMAPVFGGQQEGPEQFETLTGEQLGQELGTQLPSDAIYKRNRTTGEVSRVGAPGTSVNVNTGDGLSPGRKAVDQAYAPQYVDWRTTGGVDMATQMAQTSRALQDMQGAIERGEELSGPLIGALPRGLAAIVNPQAVDTREQVEEVVQRNLRAVLGAQFAQNEGQQLVSRAYNPQLDTKTNVLRVQKLFESLSQAAQAKEAMAVFFEENGTLMGYRGPTVNIGALYEAVGAAPNPQAAEAVFNQQLQFLTPEQRAQALELWPKLSDKDKAEYMKRIGKQ